eukprot:GHVN01072631.1.p1 GENE.GHVN01072631.1~~GHVN01072631.1.p1  ORF type:complete len:2121 (+),score=622.23 GHVN01072631.1:646-6363(+)
MPLSSVLLGTHMALHSSDLTHLSSVTPNTSLSSEVSEEVDLLTPHVSLEEVGERVLKDLTDSESAHLKFSSPLVTSSPSAHPSHPSHSPHSSHPSYSPHSSHPSHSPHSLVPHEGVYVLTGGTGALGQLVAVWMLENGARHVALLSRTGTLPVLVPNESTSTTNELKEWASSPSVSVDLRSCDVSDLNSLKKTLIDLETKYKKIRGVVHLAGVLADGAIENLSQVDVEVVVRSKLESGWHLHHALLSMGYDAKPNAGIPTPVNAESQCDKKLDFFILFSSTASLFGNFGQSNYAAANSGLDSLAVHRRARGQVACSLQWGPWKEQGMSLAVAGLHRSLGIKALSNDVGLRCLDAAVRDSVTHGASAVMSAAFGVQSVNWRTLAQGYETLPALYREVAPADLLNESSEAHNPSAALIFSLPQDERYERVKTIVETAAKRALGNDTLPPSDRSLVDLGIDSLGAVEFRQSLVNQLGVKLSATTIFDYPTVNALIAHISEKVESKVSGVSTERVTQLNPPAPLLPHAATESIAILSMACRLPGDANNPNSFWEMMRSGRDCMRPIPSERWSIDDYFDANPDAPGKVYVKEGAFINNAHLFDAGMFNMSRGEAMVVDPQQRVMLEVACETLFEAGLSRKETVGMDLGVFIGVCLPDWTYSLREETLQPFSGTGLVPSIVSNRISYVMGVRGPSFSVDTACSASLVALNLGVDKLHNTDCTYALAGGVQLNLAPFPFIAFCKARLLSPDCRSRTFDADANGYARGEGSGAVLMCLKSQAALDKRKVWGYVRGSHINHDGRSANLIAPSGPAQQEVILSSLRKARLRGAEVEYLESHGTGTALGDPIEVGAVKAVYNRDPKHKPLIMGALKTNIGHLEGAAGIAGFIKALIIANKREAPPILHLKKMNPYIEVDGFNAVFPTSLRNFKNEAHQLRDSFITAVSSFGFGGALAHAIIECGDPSEVSELNKLSEVNEVNSSSQSTQRRKTCVFMFTGQGSQFVNMGLDLYNTIPVFKKAVDYVDSLFKPLLDGLSITSLIYPSATHSDLSETTNTVEGEINKTSLSQISIFTVEYALAQTWKAAGITPDIVLGHSIGEYAAAVSAGIFSVEDAVSLVAKRAELMEKARPGGVMAAVRSSPAEIRDAIKKERSINTGTLSSVALACINAPESCVVAGEKSEVESLLTKMGLISATRYLSVGNAFHSPAMSSVVPVLVDYINTTPISITPPSNVKFISTVSETSAKFTEAQYWGDQVTHTVDFVSALSEIAGLGDNVIIEVGPKPILTRLGMQCVRYQQTRKTHTGTNDGTDITWIAPQGTGMEKDGGSHLRQQQERVSEVMKQPNRLVFNHGEYPLPYFQPLGKGAGGEGTSLTSGEESASLKQISKVVEETFELSTGMSWRSIDDDTPLSEMGIDSMSFFAFRNNLITKAEIEIPLNFFAGRDLTKIEINAFLISQFNEAHSTGSLPTKLIESTKEGTTDGKKDETVTSRSLLSGTQPRSLPAASSSGDKTVTPHSTSRNNMPHSPWFDVIPKSRPHIRLICFPYGGGSTDIFRSWSLVLPRWIELMPVCLPGRGDRHDEDPLDDVMLTARRIVDECDFYKQTKTPFAMLGVSVGAIICYEIAVLLQERGEALPVHIFPICCAAPHVYRYSTVRAANMYRLFSGTGRRSSLNLKQVVDIMQGGVLKRRKERKEKKENQMRAANGVSGVSQVGHGGRPPQWSQPPPSQSTSTHQPVSSSIAISEVTGEMEDEAREFVMDFLAAASYRGVNRFRDNHEFANEWALIFSGDAAMALNYWGQNRPAIPCDITAIEGAIDAVSRATPGSMESWDIFTSTKFSYVLMGGGDHYLVHAKGEETCEIIVTALKSYFIVPAALQPVTDSGNNIMESRVKRMFIRTVGRFIPTSFDDQGMGGG